MFAKKILVFSLLSFLFSQVFAADANPGESNGITRLASNSMNGMTTILDSGAHAAASGVGLTTSSVANGIKTVGGAADLANNAQQIKFDALTEARKAAGQFGASLSGLGSSAIVGALRRGAIAVDATKRASQFTLAEADRVGRAGKNLVKSVIANSSGSLVNVFNGANKVVTSTGEVRQEVADTAGAIHDASTDLVKEGVKTWKDVGLSSINSLKAGMQDRRKKGTNGPTKGTNGQTIGTNGQTTGTNKKPDVKQEPAAPAAPAAAAGTADLKSSTWSLW